MGVYKYLRQAWQKPSADVKLIWRHRLIAWRRDPSCLKIEHPTRLDKAKALGYKAKQGFFNVRQRVLRGGHQRSLTGMGARKSGNQRAYLNLRKNYQWIAEERASKDFPNCEVLNSYYAAEDGKHYWYEIIMVDRSHPVVVNDKSIAWINSRSQKGRTSRGLTSAGRRARGLLWKGKGSEKTRPSRASQTKQEVFLLLKKELKKPRLDDDEIEEEEKKEEVVEDENFSQLDEDEDVEESSESFPEEEAFVDEESLQNKYFLFFITKKLLYSTEYRSFLGG